MASRLAAEPSPYLQQHKDNPVDWWPWCDAAFTEARRRDVPVFLSIGYATCHWCHVMAHESFEDDAIARTMNDAFVCIKVDREERPDLDSAYMAACQAMNGSGGWPLTVLLDHDRRPWFAGTYFPPTTRGGRIGMDDLVPRLSAAWRDRRADVLHDAEHLLQHLRRAPSEPGDVDGAWLARAAADLGERFDHKNGGFGQAPKFPSPHQVRFLLRHHHRTGDKAALEQAVATLRAIAAGGIHDHVGGGFHRYSTDPAWRLPHFEKMLYDQANLLIAYAEAHQATGDAWLGHVCRDIAAYLARDLSDDDGAFYSAEDADSEGEEGRFYTWTHAEVVEALGDAAAAFCDAFSVRPEGNHHDEATGRPTGRNILARDPSEPRPSPEERRLLDRLRRRRGKRPRPLRDEKVLTDWNGLTIGALAYAGMATGEAGLVDMARRAAVAVLDRLGPADHLSHRWKDGQRDGHAFLDDHAALGAGLLRLFEATQDPRWLHEAKAVAEAMMERFEDEAGGFRLAPAASDVIVNGRDAYDGASSSGNALAVELLWRLGRITGETRFEDAARRAVKAFAAEIGRVPGAFTAMLCTVDAMLAGGEELVVAGSGPGAASMLAEARSRFRPGLVLLHQTGEAFVEHAPWTSDHAPLDGQATAYLCRDHACRAPVTTPGELAALLDQPSSDA